MGNAVQYEATVCVVQGSMWWKGNQIRDKRILREGGCDWMMTGITGDHFQVISTSAVVSVSG